MPIHGCSGTLPDRLTGPDAPFEINRNAATLPARVRAGRPRRASDARRPGMSTQAGSGGLSYTVRYFLAGRQKRAAMRIERAEARLTVSMHRFIDQWKRREIDELRPHQGARLLGEACAAARPSGQEIAQSAMMAILRHCLAAIKEPEELSQLYNDLVAPRPVTRALADRQSASLRDVAAHMLDALEQALAEALAERIGTPLLGRLLVISEHSRDAAHKVRETLEQLHGIGLWLSSASRSPARILSHTLDILTDDELGQLAAQAWPELSVRDEHYGAEAPRLRAALAFLEVCEGEALATWRAAVQLQLDGRKRLVAVRTAHVVDSVVDPGRLGEAMRAVYGQLDNAAIVLTGKLHNANLLRASVRTDVLLQVLRHLPESWRGQGLRALRARELSSIKSSLADSPGLTAMDTSVTALINSVQEDMLDTDRRSVEAALAALHEAIAVRDRTVAVSRLGALVDALQELNATLRAFSIDMPATLDDSLRQLLDRMRSLLPGGRGDKENGKALRGLSDAELGALRQAASKLSPYGTLLDRNALKSAIALRSGIPARADQAMDALLASLADGGASLADVHARLRDVADVLVRLNERRVAMGEETSADANDALVADVVERAIARAAVPVERQSMQRLGLTGATLFEPLYALADWISRQPRDEALRLDRCAARLTIARRLEHSLHDALCRQGETDDAPDKSDDDALRAVLAGEYGIEWEAGNFLARPCISRATHAAVEARLKAAIGDLGADDADDADDADEADNADDPDEAGWEHLPHGLGGDPGRSGERGGHAGPARSIRLYAADGESAWFLVDQRFEHDMLGGPGMALAVEGVNAQGITVCSPGFSVRLDKDARFAAVGAAMHALRELSGGAMPALLQCLHRGIPKAYTAAIAAGPERLLLHLPDGSRVGCPTTPPAATEFRVRRETDGEYSVAVFLTWTGTANLPLPGAKAVDPSRSFVKAAFVLAADAQGRMYALRETVDLRYRLAATRLPR
ncbi:hypothetical protein BOSP111201_14625 [Bordetella sputigena]|uniref:hypothetical protein n=1 Tax=Bordetella sputigena TaxID=1416810 RepID=UPI0039EFAD86